MRALLLLLALGSAQEDALLARRPADLPRAELGTWAQWERASAPPAVVREGYAAALTAYQWDDAPRALAHVYALLEKAPDYPAGLHLLGVAHFRLRRYGDAAEAFERFLAHSPQLVGRTRVLGHCYYSLGRYDEALAHYALVLAAAPDDVEARRGLALARMRSGDTEGALLALARVLAHSPAHADARYWRARILYEDERLDEARTEVREACKLAPRDPRGWFLCARIEEESGAAEVAAAARARFAELDAVERAARALEARLLYAPADLALLRELSELRLEAGDVARARPLLERALAQARRLGTPDAAHWARARRAALEGR
jgi:tetratricopeptide (TPR) repeat protein